MPEIAPTPAKRKKRGKSPTARTLDHLRARGYSACVVEKYNHHIRQRFDAFGFGDILGIGDGQAGAFLVQACSGTDHAKRRAKMLAEPLLAEWLRFGNRVYLISWSKKGKRGARKLWEIRKEPITLSDLSAVSVAAGEGGA